MILFTADIHIKLGQKNVPKAWAKSRYKAFFEQVGKASENVDMHIIGGDIFDRTPTLEEVELYFDFISSCTVPTLIYDGNHEATRKTKTFLTTLKDVTSLVNPLVRIVDEVEEHEWGTILPYCCLHKKGVIEGLNKTKPLFTHVRGEIQPHVKPEIDLERLKDFPVVFAGDLHARSNTQLNIVYPGSPMTTSFHRNEVETGCLFIDGEAWEWQNFELPQLLRKTVTSQKEMVPTEYHHTIYEIEGDLSELAGIKNTELLDKKVVKRSTEASLILDGDMTITEELYEYLLYILELPADKASNIVSTFNDYTETTQVE
jgi:DNA repair exonuclease SbcCD nuclease subunit